MEAMNFVIHDDNLFIKVPVSLIRFAAENNPETKYKVLSEGELADKVMFQLEHKLGSYETGLTGLQMLIDRAIHEVAESGEECIEIINP